MFRTIPAAEAFLFKPFAAIMFAVLLCLPSGLLAGTQASPDTRHISVEKPDTSDTAKPLPASAETGATGPRPVQAEKKPSATAPAQAQPAALPKPVSALPAAEAVTVEDVVDVDENPSAGFLMDADTEVITGPDGKEKPAPPLAAAITADNDALKMKTGDFLNPLENNIRYFSVSVKKHFTRWLSRSGKYMDLMKSILRENYLPEDLVFLALIESGFNPKAYSWAKASGPWQFIKGTAVRYGLRVDRWVDERRDPVKSTKAAAAYLRDLYGMFGSWPLAMASYNCGEGNVARAVKRNDTLDFWELRKTRSLPSETKEYVPKFMAAKMIAQNPEEYGFDPIEYEKPWEFDEVELDKCTDLSLVAKCCGVPVEEIKELNPELIRGCTPPNLPLYTLRIPKGTKELFLANYAAIPDGERIANPRIEEPKKLRYTVRRGDTLKGVAKKHGITVAALAKANRLTVNSKLKKGRRLNIPRDDDGGPVMVASAGKVSSKATAYKVKKGDTLSGIARKHGLTTAQLARMNGISARARVKAGQRLALSAKSSVKSAKKAASKKTLASKKTYKVKKGDTIYSISKRFGVSKEALLKANSIRSASSIKAGQRLVIPEEA